jgi:hypothetical protein
MTPQPSPELDREEFRWTRVVSPQHLNEFYETILPQIREAARQHGYAIAVHGSMKRDFDLIAAPWSAEHSDAQTLCKAIHRAACGLVQESYQICTDKPCGRLTTMFPVCWIEYPDAPKNGTGHIDLSIMPDSASLAKQPATNDSTETPETDELAIKLGMNPNRTYKSSLTHTDFWMMVERSRNLEKRLTAATKRAKDNELALYQCYAATGEDTGDLDDFRALVDRESVVIEAVKEATKRADEAEAKSVIHYMTYKTADDERNALQLRVKELEKGKERLRKAFTDSDSDFIEIQRMCNEGLWWLIDKQAAKGRGKIHDTMMTEFELRTAIDAATGKEKE